jgi:hypothetical protein
MLCMCLFSPRLSFSLSPSLPLCELLCLVGWMVSHCRLLVLIELEFSPFTFAHAMTVLNAINVWSTAPGEGKLLGVPTVFYRTRRSWNWCLNYSTFWFFSMDAHCLFVSTINSLSLLQTSVIVYNIYLWTAIAQSVQRWATGWTIGVLGFDFRRGLVIFLFTTASRTVLGPTQPPIQWIPGALSSGVKRLGREADHSPPSSAEVKEFVELYLHSLNTPSWRGA